MTGSNYTNTYSSVKNFVHYGLFSSVGYFVEPTILKTTDPKNKLMQEVTKRLPDFV